MRTLLRSENRWRAAVVLLFGGLLLLPAEAATAILHLKNGDRLTGRIVSETTNVVTLATPFYGSVQVPLDQIGRREALPETLEATNRVGSVIGTNRNNTGAPPVPKVVAPKPPLTPSNPEATPIASTPNFWKHDFRFGLNLRYAANDSHEVLIIGKSTYGKPPFRHIFDGSFKYGTIEGVLSANSVAGSEKTEYQLSPKTYLFNLVGGGFDEIRHIKGQFEIGPGLGVELLKLTNFVWKTESGFNFQQQYRTDHTEQLSYSIRIAEIFAWRIWEKLTADTKFEFFPNLAELGEYRLRAEGTLRYPVSNRLSLNLELIDIYDSQPAQDVTPNDMQIRSTIGVTF